MNMKKNLIASTIVLSIGLAGNANAGAYAVAYNEIFDLSISPTDPGNVLFNNLPAAPTSTAGATLNGTGEFNGGVGLNAPAANGGGGTGTVTRLDNVFNQFGAPGTYSNSDAAVLTTITSPGADRINAATIAEGALVSNGNAAANAFNGSTTTFTVQVTLLDSGEIAFDFDADPFMQTFLNANALPTPQSFAQANLSANISIVDTDTGALVFDWSPDGGVGGISGGTEIADEANLNTGISANNPLDNIIFDPTGDGSFGAGSPGNHANFTAITDTLDAGVYNLTIGMGADISLQKTIDEVEVPEPASLALLSIGLLGFGFVSNRRRKD